MDRRRRARRIGRQESNSYRENDRGRYMQRMEYGTDEVDERRSEKENDSTKYKRARI